MAQVTTENRRNRKWTNAEDERLLRQIRAFPQNLSRCFIIVAEETGRTEKAVAAHWYSQLSKKENSLCFFTASPKHIAKNRKNGMGEVSNNNIWNRLMIVLKRFI